MPRKNCFWAGQFPVIRLIKTWRLRAQSAEVGTTCPPVLLPTFGGSIHNLETMKLRWRCLISAVLVVFLQSAMPGKTQSTPTTKLFEGCYELRLGRWWPWSFGQDNQFVTPPSRINLLSERGTKGFEQDGFLIRAISQQKGAAQVRGGSSYWQVRSNNHIDLIWNDGFSGVTLALRTARNELRGWAHPHFDVPIIPPRIRRVTARRISCDAPQ
jgi:hypothetical protein